MSGLPAFLEPYGPSQASEPSTSPAKYLNAAFRHTKFPSLAHAYWWPCKAGVKNETCVLFIPGNPGLLDWYTPFLAALHEKSQESVNILAHAHVGHTPSISHNTFHRSALSLAAQVEHVLEVVDAVKASGYTKIVLVGHSAGTWLSMQVLKQRPGVIDAAFLLFPTITHIAKTPNGRACAVFFVGPLPHMISSLSVFTRLIPTWFLSKTFLRDWPDAQIKVLKSLWNSPETIYALLSMAREEMRAIKDLDVDLLQENSHRLHLYFAEVDSWVGKHKEEILHAFNPDQGNVRIVHGKPDIPHAFCINHGEDLAQTCFEWLVDGQFVTIQ